MGAGLIIGNVFSKARILLLVSGCLLFAGGMPLFITNETSSRGLILSDDRACSTADREQSKLEQLVERYEAEKRTPEQTGLRFEVENQIKIVDRWGITCEAGKSCARLRFIFFLSVTVTGFLLLITFFLTGHKKID